MREKGGWENRDVVEAFGRYAQTCFTLFWRPRHWFTFIVSRCAGQAAICTTSTVNVVDFKRAAAEVAYHTVLAHSTAVRAWRAGRYDGEIGVVLNTTPSYPLAASADVQAAHHAGSVIQPQFFLTRY